MKVQRPRWNSEDFSENPGKNRVARTPATAPEGPGARRRPSRRRHKYLFAFISHNKQDGLSAELKLRHTAPLPFKRSYLKNYARICEAETRTCYKTDP